MPAGDGALHVRRRAAGAVHAADLHELSLLRHDTEMPMHDVAQGALRSVEKKKIICVCSHVHGRRGVIFSRKQRKHSRAQQGSRSDDSVV